MLVAFQNHAPVHSASFCAHRAYQVIVKPLLFEPLRYLPGKALPSLALLAHFNQEKSRIRREFGQSSLGWFPV